MVNWLKAGTREQNDWGHLNIVHHVPCKEFTEVWNGCWHLNTVRHVTFDDNKSVQWLTTLEACSSSRYPHTSPPVELRETADDTLSCSPVFHGSLILDEVQNWKRGRLPVCRESEALFLSDTCVMCIDRLLMPWQLPQRQRPAWAMDKGGPVLESCWGRYSRFCFWLWNDLMALRKADFWLIGQPTARDVWARDRLMCVC